MKGKLLLTLALFSTVLFGYPNGNDGETRTAKVNYKVDASTRISVLGKNTELRFESWSKNEVEVEATAFFDGKMTDKMQEFLDNFEEKVKQSIEQGGGELLIDTDVDAPNKISIGSRRAGVIIGYNDDEFRVEFIIRVPQANSLRIESAYEECIMIGKYARLELIQNSGEVTIDELQSGVLKLKYGEATIRSLGSVEMELYEQEMDIESIQSAKINTKYGELEIGTAQYIDMVGYETDISARSIEKLDANLKYGNLTVENRIGTSNLTLYEFDIKAGSVLSVQLVNSKYSSLSFDKGHSVIFQQSYEDEVKARYLNVLKSEQSKYGEYIIDQLGEEFVLAGYEDKVAIGGATKETREIRVSGKYQDVNIKTSGIPYALDGDIRYGKIIYDKEKVETSRYIKESEKLTVLARTKGNSEKKLSINIRGYEVDATISN